MSTLRQYNNGTVVTEGSAKKNAVTFTTTSSYNIDSVVLPLFREGSPGTLTVSIYATSSGLPSGSPLTSGTYNGNSLSDSYSSPTIATISVTPYLLAASTQYAIVTTTNTEYPNGVNWLMSSTSAYPDGVSYYYVSDWKVSPHDYIFETYGDPYAPTVTTQSVTTIASTTATGRGNVTSDGGATVTERGVCWSTSSTPTTAGSKATASGTTGAFTASITGLSPSTLYYVRAYAINSVGTSYGSQVTFTTSAQKITFGEYLGAGSGTTKLLLHLNGSSTDSSGNNNNGTDTNITYGLGNGKFGQGALFNGSSSNISISDTASLKITGNITISAWINPSSAPKFTCVAGKFLNSTNKSYWLAFNGGKAGMFISTNGSNQTGEAFSQALSNGVWYNVIGTYDGTNTKIYVNGSLANSIGQTGGIYDSTGSFAVGKLGSLSSDYFPGKIDEVIIENRAWTASEIKKYYTYSKGRFGIL